jgi:hypothetical protein
VPYSEARAAQQIDKIVELVPEPLAAIAANKTVIVCAEGHQAGVTTTLLWLLSQAFTASDARLPIYLNSPGRLGTARGEQTLRAVAALVGYARTDGALPDLLIAVDDVT